MTTEKRTPYRIRNWHKLDAETLKFLFGESEKLLAAHIETAKLLKDRAESIIKFTSPSMLVLLAFIIKSLNDSSINFAFWVAAYVFVVLLIITILAIGAFAIYRIRPLGNEPFKMINETNTNSRNSYKVYLVSRICTIQEMIWDNEAENYERLSKLKTIRSVILASVIAALLITIVKALTLIF